MQAIIRLLIAQRNADRRAGLNTAGFVSGYRGSPLGGLDLAMWRAGTHLDANDIRFQPGVNEDLAATAIWGTQQVGLFSPATKDGVFGLWYGKGPGIDRSGDPLKHGNLAGSSPNGGVLVVAGDDHGAQSSTTAHQSEQAMIAAMMPILYPATVQEFIDYGLYGYALSRFSGCWIGFKAVAEAIEGSAVVSVAPDRVQPILPADFVFPDDGVHIRWPDSPSLTEPRMISVKLPAVKAFVRANGLNLVTHDCPDRRFGIVAAGKAWLDVCQALEELGLDDDARGKVGLSVYKVAMPWPLETEGLREWAEGLDELLVIEEKRNLMEDQIARALYDVAADQRPNLVGKLDENGEVLVPAFGELSGVAVAEIIARRLAARGTDDVVEGAMAALTALTTGSNRPTASVDRVAWFCAGCPHNTSTKLPEGSFGLAGIGCHTMAVFMDRGVGAYTHMGGEGATWIGQAPFTDAKHVFQQLGDGTYFHSGLMAIRAAVAADVNITYKILYNDAVAMTGGQPVEGSLLPWQISQQLHAEGVTAIKVVTDEPKKYPSGTNWAPGVTISHRDDLDTVQRDLREISGVTALIYDQTCAAEKRRRRKRGTFPDPAKRVVINELVCEGCGDCGVQSNCVAVHPLETEFGRKRVIHQSSCNKDYSCVNGFCPSFVTVEGGGLKGAVANDKTQSDVDVVADLPVPTRPDIDSTYNVVVAGVGGTGVVTVGALLGMAAHLDGKGCTVLDQTGLAQKNGAVLSHVRISNDPSTVNSPRVGTGATDLLLGCDMIVAAGSKSLPTLSPVRSHAVINDHVFPIAAFAKEPDLAMEEQTFSDTITGVVARDRTHMVNATYLATALMGDAIAANLFLVGYALQKGLLPIGVEAMEQAIRLNGVAVDSNLQSIAWGRLASHDMARVLAEVSGDAAPFDGDSATEDDLEFLLARRIEFLTDYQNTTYAARYEQAVRNLAAVEAEKTPGQTGLAIAAARYLFKLMAYKDEYEVARLFTDGTFRNQIGAQFEGNYRLRYHMAPPLLARIDKTTSQPRKMAFGPWMGSAMKILAGFKGLRGTPFDPFGRSEERREERRLITEYENLLTTLATELIADNHAFAVELAGLPEKIRGYGHIKTASIEEAKVRQEELLAAFRGTETARAAG